MSTVDHTREARTGGIAVCGALGIGLVILKLCGVIDWSWWWVLAPFWILPGVLLVVLVALQPGAAWVGVQRRPLSSKPETGVRPPPEPEYEPVHGWTLRQCDDYLARNPGYRSAYEAELRKHTFYNGPRSSNATHTGGRQP
jgi:hypothetical protein